MTFDGVHATLARALAARGYATPTPVQLAVLQPEAEGRDQLVSARTGSGKTVAYGLALAPTLLGEAETFETADAPLALVIAPTRELALQVARELEWLYAEAKGRVVTCVGGMDPRREQRALAAGAHIVVGTPGRLRDHIERGQLRTGAMRAVVLDEADEMLDLGFREELEEILDATPPQRRTLLFSATLPAPIVRLAQSYQRDALRIVADAGEEPHGDIEYRVVRVAPSDVDHAVVNLLRYFEAGAAMVFCSTREAVRKLHANLVERGFPVVALSGELSQTERTHALQALRDRRARVCVATDVAARGIDIPDLDLVIHAELPADAETLKHRSGRTGRAGRKGVCILLAPHPRRRRAELLLKNARISASWMAPPTADEIRAGDQQRLVDQVLAADATSDDDIAAARALLERGGAEAIVAALVGLARIARPAPEDLIDNAPEPDAPSRPESRAGFEGSSWFRIDIGRNKNADPRWLLPLICRRGHVTKRDIGAIRVFDRETRFEIAREAADRFRAALPKTESDGGMIEPIDDPMERPARDRQRPPRRDNAERPPAREPPRAMPPRHPPRPRSDRHEALAENKDAIVDANGPKTSKRQSAKFGGPKLAGPNAAGSGGPRPKPKSNAKSRGPR